jgi:hypothetical protein
LDHFHIDPIKIAEWIIDQRIKILGIFDDPGKSIPKEVTSSEVGESKLSQAIDMLRRELRLCLKARSDLIHRVDAGSGASFDLVDQIDEFENKILSLIGFFIFDKDDFERVFLAVDKDRQKVGKQKTTKTDAQECFINLLDDGFWPKNWREILDHPEIHKIMGHMSSEVKKREYLRGIVRERTPHVTKSGAPKKGTSTK